MQTLRIMAFAAAITALAVVAKESDALTIRVKVLDDETVCKISKQGVYPRFQICTRTIKYQIPHIQQS